MTNFIILTRIQRWGTEDVDDIEAYWQDRARKYPGVDFEVSGSP